MLTTAISMIGRLCKEIIFLMIIERKIKSWYTYTMYSYFVVVRNEIVQLAEYGCN